MGSLTNFAENELLDHVLGTGVWTMPTTYLALGTGGSEEGLDTEVSGSNYSRVATPSWNAAASRSIDTSATVTFPQATGSWGTPDTWALYDALSDGNCIAYGSITTPTAIGNTQTASFAAGQILISFNASESPGNVGWSTSIANALLDHLVGRSAYTPVTLYVGFGTTPLTDAGSISGEASGGGYARTAAGSFGAAANGTTSNSGAITFTVSGTWTTNLDVIFVANHLSNTDNANLLFFGEVTSMSPVSGDTVEISIGDLDISLS